MNTKEEIETQIKIADIMKSNIRADESLMTKMITGDVVIRLNDNNKSILEIGNIKLYNIKKFNWFHRIMFKLVFGIKIENIKEEIK